MLRGRRGSFDLDADGPGEAQGGGFFDQDADALDFGVRQADLGDPLGQGFDQEI